MQRQKQLELEAELSGMCICFVSAVCICASTCIYFCLGSKKY